jgi:hypothetical protein
MRLSEWETARELIPGFCVLIRWPRVSFWPWVHVQFWKWSLTFRSAWPETTLDDEVGTPVA